jgi:hypothetical protein
MSTALVRRWTCCGSGYSRRGSDGDETMGHIEAGRMMVMLNRTDYWQCGYLIPKGGLCLSRRNSRTLRSDICEYGDGSNDHFRNRELPFLPSLGSFTLCRYVRGRKEWDYRVFC